MLAVVLAAAGWWVLRPSAPTGPAAAGEPAAKAAASPSVLPLSAEQARALGVAWAAATAASEAPIAALPGTIAPPANARVAATALFAGVIERIQVVEGDSVRKGQPLALIRSTEILSLHSDLVRARARLGVARSSARRLGQLARDGVIAGARAEEAQAVLREAEADVAEKQRILAMAGASGTNGAYTLTAPIAGRVTSAGAKAGDRLEGGSAPFVIDAAGAYEVNAQLPERFAGRVRPGMAVRLGDVPGTIVAVGATVDPQTRSVLLKAKLPAGPGVISGGSVSLTLMGPAPAGAVLVPSDAVVDLNGRDVAFVRAGSGVQVRPVALGESGGGGTLVLSGLKPGEQVVASGTSALKALALAQ